MLYIEAGTAKFGNRRSDLNGVPEFNGLLKFSVNPHQRKPHIPESAFYVHPLYIQGALEHHPSVHVKKCEWSSRNYCSARVTIPSWQTSFFAGFLEPPSLN
jgi:hypothetical protein